ncbi:hypothetical protein [Streptomyces sp. NPDC059489]
MSAIFDCRDALKTYEELAACLTVLIALKQCEPGDDVTTWLIQPPPPV